jgi:hypothetical protein
VRTAKKTKHFTITTINWLTLFKEIIPVYGESLYTHNTKREFIDFQSDGIWRIKERQDTQIFIQNASDNFIHTYIHIPSLRLELEHFYCVSQMISLVKENKLQIYIQL